MSILAHVFKFKFKSLNLLKKIFQNMRFEAKTLFHPTVKELDL
jgi:hypothetical protein